jgi:hypothetical protein
VPEIFQLPPLHQNNSRNCHIVFRFKKVTPNIVTVIMFLDIIHHPVFYLKQNVSDIGFCLRLRVEPTQLTKVSSHLRAPAPKSKLLYDRRSVSQYVLVSSPLGDLRPTILSECCLKVAVLFLWGPLSDERTGLQFAVQSLNDPSHAEPVTILPQPGGPVSRIYMCGGVTTQIILVLQMLCTFIDSHSKYTILIIRSCPPYVT